MGWESGKIYKRQSLLIIDQEITIMKNVAIFVSTLGTGGAEKQAALLANVLSRHYQVHVVALYSIRDNSEYVLNLLKTANIKTYLLRGLLLQKLIAYGHILKSNNIYCVFNYLTKCDFWGAIIAKKFGVKKIYNGIRNSELESWKTVLEKISHNYFATATIFNCYSGETAFKERGFKIDKCITIPNCFPEIQDPIIRAESSIKHIITVGRFHPQKDYETIIKIIAILKRYRKDFRMIICGYGILEQDIRHWAKQYNVNDIIEFYIKPNNISDLLQQSDIYLSTSLFEGTSNSIMEAMNWSLPVVATNVGDNNHLIQDGINGILHPICDARGMANSINMLLDNYALRIEMGKKGNENLRLNYSMNLFEQRYLHLID